MLGKFSRTQERTSVPAVSQVPIFFAKFTKETDGTADDAGNAYFNMMRDMIVHQRITVPEDMVQITLEHAAVSFLHNDDFRTALFRNSDAQILGRNIRSVGYFEILKNGVSKDGSVFNGRLFRPVDSNTFYNVLAPEERSFHICGGVGNVYIVTDYLKADFRGLIITTDPFHSTDYKMALARKADLENVLRDVSPSILNKAKRLFTSAYRTYF